MRKDKWFDDGNDRRRARWPWVVGAVAAVGLSGVWYAQGHPGVAAGINRAMSQPILTESRTARRETAWARLAATTKNPLGPKQTAEVWEYHVFMDPHLSKGQTTGGWMRAAAALSTSAEARRGAGPGALEPDLWHRYGDWWFPVYAHPHQKQPWHAVTEESSPTGLWVLVAAPIYFHQVHNPQVTSRLVTAKYWVELTHTAQGWKVITTQTAGGG